MYKEEDFYDEEELFASEDETVFTRLNYKGYYFYVMLGYDEKDMTPYWVLKNDKLGECSVKCKEIKDIKEDFEKYLYNAIYENFDEKIKRG